ncbi:MAG TPA: hypothetical protein VF787_12410 [Thermoanaerobaculia bacterium]
MRHLSFALAFILLSFTATAQEESAQLRRNRTDWTTYADKGCVGGDQCRTKRLRVTLEDRPVIAVRFTAHDQIGTKAEGVLRVKIDGNTIKDYLDIPRRGETFTVDVDELTGRALVFEPVNDDEVEISDIAVLYGRNTIRRDPPRGGGGSGRPGNWGGSGGGWRPYPRAAACIGGTECRKNGNRITIALENAPVLGVRFYAHDSIGTRADGRLTVRIDDTNVAWFVDIKREGRTHDFDVDSVSGSKLIIETASDDEVEVKDIEVMYGRRGSGGGSGGGYGRGEVRHEGDCIGGDQCGGKRARIRIAIDGRAVEQIRFYARDDIGTRAGGELRIRIDDEVVENYIDIPREGKTFTIDGHNIAGDYLYIEPAEDDEVDIKDIRITFRD